jgi:hypothetical protein
VVEFGNLSVDELDPSVDELRPGVDELRPNGERG